MSESVPKKRLKKSQRFIKLVEGMREGKTFFQIAKDCSCSEKTIDRDFKEWKDNGGFNKWLFAEFMLLHEEEINKEKGSQAYRVVADLLKKQLKEQSEMEVKGEASIIIKSWDPDAKTKSGPSS